MQDELKPGDLCEVLGVKDAWEQSNIKYEDWLAYDKNRQGELVLVLETYSLYGIFDGRVLVTNAKGNFYTVSKFLKRIN